MISRVCQAVDGSFWQGKSVLVTGHTGFKGGWLSLWLSQMGAKVHGYALPPLTEHNFFNLTEANRIYNSSQLKDVRDSDAILKYCREQQPEIIFHLAAQPLVRRSYADPVETFESNIMGTLHLLQAARQIDSIRAVVVVTSDKCYENREWAWGYRENEALGGHDPYSASKACAELVAHSWQVSFFEDTEQSPCAVATARAGNVIGGGDWSEDRLIPDVLASLDAGNPVVLRNPAAVRPWQHVLEPLSGYLLLAEKLYTEGAAWAEPWNFGPSDADTTAVADVVSLLMSELGSDDHWQQDHRFQPAEAQLLRLDCSKARQRLQWLPVWSLQRALKEVAIWHSSWRKNHCMHQVSIDTIDRYVNDITH